MGGDVVGDVDERRLGTNPQDHALHRPGVVVAGPEVAEKGNDGRIAKEYRS